MGNSANPRQTRPLGVRTANERLKAEGSVRTHRSIMLSVLLHIGLVAGWPAFDVDTLDSTSMGSGAHLQLVSLGELTAPGAPGVPAPPALPGPEDGDAEESGTDGVADEGTAAGLGTEGWSGTSDDLWRLARLEAEFVPFDFELDTESVEESGDEESVRSSGDDDQGVEIRQRTSNPEFQRLSEDEMLSLERLSALRPELVLVSPSNWLVLRNPKAVGDFLDERFRTYGVGGKGSLSVSLWVDDRGSVEWAEINDSSGHEAIDASALELFQNVVAFRPAREEGSRVPVAAIFWLMW